MANIHKIFSYGRRNGFGLAFDPMTGFLWESENGDDAFDEMNRITAGSNGGWIQIMGPLSRLADFKQIESSFTPLQGNLPSPEPSFQPDRPGHVHPARCSRCAGPRRYRRHAGGGPLAGCSCCPARTTTTPSSVGCGPWLPRALASRATGSARSTPATCSSASPGRSSTSGYLFDFKFDPGRRAASPSATRSWPTRSTTTTTSSTRAEREPAGRQELRDRHRHRSRPRRNLYVTSLSNGVAYRIQ